MRTHGGLLQTAALRYFSEVVERGSIHAAAASLLVAGSAISRQIQLLERELGVQLFERQPQGMAVTPSGQALYDYTLRMREEEVTLKHVLVHGQQVEGKFSVATVEGMLAPLSVWVKELRNTYPNVWLDVACVPAAEVESKVLHGGADIGFVFGSAARAGIDELAKCASPIQLAVHKDNELAYRASVSVEELKGQRLVLPSKTFGIRQEVEKACLEYGVHLSAVCETNSLHFALELVTTLPGATVSTSAMVRSFRRRNDVAVINIDHSRLRSTRVTLMSKQDPTAGPVVAELRRFFRARMNKTAL